MSNYTSKGLSEALRELVSIHVTKKLRIAVTAAFSFPEHLPAHIAVLKVSPYFSTALSDNVITYVHELSFLRVFVFF